MLSLLSTLISIQKHTGARGGLNRTWLTELTEELPQLVWAADSHGVKTFCSRKYLEYTGAETVSAMNSTWQSFIHPDDRIGAARRWFHSLATGEPYVPSTGCVGRMERTVISLLRPSPSAIDRDGFRAGSVSQRTFTKIRWQSNIGIAWRGFLPFIGWQRVSPTR
jgi:PAS domain-containing protein